MMSTKGQHITAQHCCCMTASWGHVPRQHAEAATQPEGHQAVPAVLLGTAHPLCLSSQEGPAAHKSMSLVIHVHLNGTVGTPLGPAMLVHIFQTAICGWLDLQWMNPRETPVPSLANNFESFRCCQNLNWLPGVDMVPELVEAKKRAVRGFKGYKKNYQKVKNPDNNLCTAQHRSHLWT